MIITIPARPKRPAQEPAPKPVVRQRIVTIKSDKTKKAEAKWKRLVETGQTIPRNYGPRED